MRKLIFFFFLFYTVLMADEILSFSADKTEVKPNDEVNFNLELLATKPYKLILTAYKDGATEKLSPSFKVTSYAPNKYQVSFTVPDVDNDIKIEAKLVEDNTVVSSTSIQLHIATMPSGLYFCSRYYTYSDVEYHPLFVNCFKPKANVSYNIGYGDDSGAAIILIDNDKFFSKYKNTYSSNIINALALSDSNVRGYYLDFDTFKDKIRIMGYGCCGNASLYFQAVRSFTSGFYYISGDFFYQYGADTENRIIATYNGDHVTITFKGGYWSCDCRPYNCCGEYRSNTYNIYILQK